ncbi:pre-mRNA-splicing factor 18 isoform X2 [Exaiptasia diaphana]|uniref:Pre-mRNA-splicing factor 18 n=1 Tax=Exaiptasia diaphana TaxID=2652724 RepID=A0A913XTC2_EXADI|nr:pre-mRNA-splicing factor 18 isoform X2 [Exaiptasia diaphana]
MEFLLAEIDRKSKQLDKNEVTSNKKYFKRGDLAAKQAENYKKKQQLKEKEKEKYGSPSGSEEFSAHPNKKRKGNDGESKPVMIPREEVIRRLRERGEPIRLFGETDEEAYQRQRRIEMMAPEINRGFRNDFKAAMERIDQEYLAELTKQGDTEAMVKAGSSGVQSSVPTVTLDDIQELAKGMGKGDDKLDQEVTLKFVEFLLHLWEQDLNTKPDETKRTLEAKIASATHRQTQAYLNPLIRKLRTKNTPVDIKEALTNITRNLIDKEYVKANDAYLQMAIGNAPWPIGVTMVGIHARTGREKIFAQNVAHVLNDETQRKYIQGLKRLMTFCQKKFPADPSKSVEYHGVV